MEVKVRYRVQEKAQLTQAERTKLRTEMHRLDKEIACALPVASYRLPDLRCSSVCRTGHVHVDASSQNKSCALGPLALFAGNIQLDWRGAGSGDQIDDINSDKLTTLLKKSHEHAKQGAVALILAYVACSVFQSERLSTEVQRVHANVRMRLDMPWRVMIDMTARA
jgi:hypothetical protein